MGDVDLVTYEFENVPSETAAFLAARTPVLFTTDRPSVYAALRAVSGSIVAMKLLHVLVATTSAALLLRRSPFTLLEKGVLAFGYFPFFEYDTVSRSYALGVLFTFAFCAALCRPICWRCARMDCDFS